MPRSRLAHLHQFRGGPATRTPYGINQQKQQHQNTPLSGGSTLSALVNACIAAVVFIFVLFLQLCQLCVRFAGSSGQQRVYLVIFRSKLDTAKLH